MKWVGLIIFMAAIIAVCAVTYKLCVFCFRKLTKSSNEKMQSVEC